MRRRLMRALRTAATLGALIVLTGFYTKPGRNNDSPGGKKNSGGKAPTPGNVGPAIKSGAKRAKKSRPKKSSADQQRDQDGQKDSDDKSDDQESTEPRSPKDRAAELGYTQRIPPQKSHFPSHGQPVFYNPKTKDYITPDVDGHNTTDGWKKFDKKGRRLGTYDSDLNYVKE